MFLRPILNVPYSQCSRVVGPEEIKPNLFRVVEAGFRYRLGLDWGKIGNTTDFIGYP